MADISIQIAQIQTATTGTELRSAIIGALEQINNDIPPQYSGSYSIIPSTISFSVAVSGYLMTQDLIIEAYPEAVLITKTITSNGTYNASDDSASGYSQVTVSLPMYTGAYSINPSTITQTILTDGLLLSSNLTINAYPEAVLISKTITSNGTYYASSDSASGYSQVTVSLPMYTGAYSINPSINPIIINTSGLLLSSDITIQPYSSAVLVSRYISSNGVYQASFDGADGYYEVQVDVSGGGGSENETKLLEKNLSGAYTNSLCSYLGSFAFAYCSNLTSVTLTSCKSIGGSAFYRCSALETAYFPSCISIGEYAFSACSALEEVYFPSCLDIGVSAFDGCANLRSVSFPACTTIWTRAFRLCTALTSIDFPACTEIYSSAFYDCYSLLTANFPVCTKIGASAFGFCTSLTSASFPSCTAINPWAFNSCASLVDIYFPNCTTIHSDAFYSCSALTSVDFPACTFVGSSAFFSCINLSTIVLGSCISIYSWAFCNCYNLLNLYLMGSSCVSLHHSSAFASTPIAGYTVSTSGVYGSIYVPESLYSVYYNDSVWSLFRNRLVSIDMTPQR